MSPRRVLVASALLTLAVAACADVWGFDDLKAGDGGTGGDATIDAAGPGPGSGRGSGSGSWPGSSGGSSGSSSSGGGFGSSGGSSGSASGSLNVCVFDN